jgi:hypothetical protein
MPNPEEQARENIDRLLSQAGWAVRNQSDANILAYRGVAIRNFTLKSGHGYRQLSFKAGWKGVSVRVREGSRKRVVIEINWYSPEAGKIKVSRDEFVLGESGKQALRWLDKRIDTSIYEFLRKNEKSLYAALSFAIDGREVSPKSPVNWLRADGIEASKEARPAWTPVHFPAISSTAFMYGPVPDRTILWKKRRVSTGT